MLHRENKSKEEYDGIDTDNLITLERLKQNQRQDYLKVKQHRNLQNPLRGGGRIKVAQPVNLCLGVPIQMTDRLVLSGSLNAPSLLRPNL